MTYKFYDTEQGQFCIDWDTCCQIIKSHHRAISQQQHSKEVTESQASTFNPLSWGLPDLHYIDVDWDKVRADSADQTIRDAYKLAAIAIFDRRGVDKMVRELKRMQAETVRVNDLIQGAMKKTSARSWAAMEKSVGQYESATDKLKLVRDLSGSILVGASSGAIAAGGAAALVAAGGGTLLKTVGKYQDSGSAGAATIEAVQNLAFVVFPAARGAALSESAKAFKLVVSVGADTGKALLEGQQLSSAIREGLVNIPANKLGDATKRLEPLLSRTAVPVLARAVVGGTGVKSQLPTIVKDTTKKVVEDRAKKVGQGWVRGAGSQGANEMQINARLGTNERRSVADAIALHDDLLLKLAVIDMAKGVGHSWW